MWFWISGLLLEITCMEFYFFYLGIFPFQAIDRSFVRYRATHILGGNVCDEITCVMRQNYPEDSLVVIIICNLRDLSFTWWSIIITMDLFCAFSFYLYV
jgi:hypothetical protein